MGWNSWDSYGTTVTRPRCSPTRGSWPNTCWTRGGIRLSSTSTGTTRPPAPHGYNENAPLILDEYGRQLPDRSGSVIANGRGFGPIAEQVHALGLNSACT